MAAAPLGGSGRKLANGEMAKPIKFGPLTWCLGRKVQVDEVEGIGMVSGEQYIEDMKKRYFTTDAAQLVERFKADVPSEEASHHFPWRVSGSLQKMDRSRAAWCSHWRTQQPSLSQRSSIMWVACSASRGQPLR